MTEDIEKIQHEVMLSPEVDQETTLVKKKIVVPPNLEVLSGPNVGEVGEIHFDRENGRVYRVVDLERYPNPDLVESTTKDFIRKVEVAAKDITGLTPTIYAYDPESLTIEMELIDGVDFTHEVDVPLEVARIFWSKLLMFQQLDLYHGDLFTRKHWILSTAGEIRLIDPIWMPVEVVDSGTTLEKVQATDKAIALLRLKDVGVKEEDLQVPTSELEKGLGSCLKNALEMAGIKIENDIGEWLDIPALKVVCASVGLVCHDLESTKGGLSIDGGRPLIVVYNTTLGRAHAEFIKDFADVHDKGYEFIAIVELPISE